MPNFVSVRQGEESGKHHRPHDASPVPSIAHEVLRSPGEALNRADTEFARSRFHFDFSKVRIHTDQRAAESAAAIGASAYTYGSHVVFGAGRYQPRTSDGTRLLMHELTHVVQQSGNGAEYSSPVGLDHPHSHAEAAAGRSGEVATGGGGPGRTAERLARPGLIQRQPQPQKPGATASGGNVPSPDAPTSNEQESGWNLDDVHVDFWVSHQVSRDASFMIAGFSKAKGPGFTTWSNPRVFSIVPNEHTWLHTNYWADTPEHPIPWDQYKPAVFNEIKFTPSGGGAAGVNVRYEDEHPAYQSPGKSLKVNLGSKSPGASDLPIQDLPLNGGGSLSWRAGFRLGGGGVTFSVDGKFQLQSAAPPLSATPDSTSQGSPSTTSTSESTGGKGQPLPPPLLPSKKNLSDETVRDIKIYTELIKKAQDAATKDPLVRKLRDALADIQPFLPSKDAQKIIDDAVRSLVKDGIDAGIMAILKQIAGKSPSAMPPAGGTPQTGPYPPSGVAGEQIFQGPKITIPDTPKLPPKLSFHFKGGPRKSYAPGEKIKFTVVPPDNFLTLNGAKRVVIVAEADRSASNPTRLDRFTLESAKPTAVELTAPDQPGKYVIRVDIGMSFEDSSMEDFEVIAPKKQ